MTSTSHTVRLVLTHALVGFRRAKVERCGRALDEHTHIHPPVSLSHTHTQAALVSVVHTHSYVHVYLQKSVW